MKAKFVGAVIIAFLLGAAVPVGYWWVQQSKDGQAQSQGKQLWTCGMHPQVVQDHPGNCPICGMKLTPIEAEAPPAKQVWTCPMHPEVIQDEPGNCPICEMKLVAVDAPVEEEHAEHGEESGGAGPAVRVSQAFLQNFAVRTVAAERGSIPVDVRTIGQLRYDEGRFVSVNTKYSGWIEKVRVNYVGEQVKAGDLLFEVYSPELVTTQKEFLAALEYLEALSADARPDAIERARALVEAAKERLRWWDVSEPEIDKLAREQKVTRTLRVTAPASGTIVERMGDSLEGMKLTPGMTVFKIADLGSLWAEIEVYEFQIQHVREGQRVRIAVDAYPGRRWTGKIVYLEPVLDAKSRTLRARVAVENPDGKLRPQMYVNVELQPAAAGRVVRVPEAVVLRTGERSVVIVEKEAGLFEPREVELGATGGGFQEIRHGLEAGEVVVASSQFLIDSESNLREAISKMLAGQGHQH